MKNTITQNDSSSANDEDWVDLCELAGYNNLVLKNFRNFQVAKEIIGGYPDYVVLEYCYRIKKISGDNYKNYLDLWDRFDKISPSESYIRITEDGKDYLLTPMTGRLLVNVINYFNIFNKLEDNINIAEIGSGIGGEYILISKILSNSKVFGIKKNFRFTIFDLPTSKQMISANCKLHGVAIPNFMYLDSNKEMQFDFVISNGALTEMSPSLIREYYDKVISKSSYSYILANFDTQQSRVKKRNLWLEVNFIDFLKEQKINFYVYLNIVDRISRFDNIYNTLYILGVNDKSIVKSVPGSILFHTRLIFYKAIKKICRIFLNKLL